MAIRLRYRNSGYCFLSADQASAAATVHALVTCLIGFELEMRLALNLSPGPRL